MGKQHVIDNEIVTICSKAFAEHPTYGPADKAISKLVSLMPRNDNLPDVLLKVVAINTLYATRILSTFKMAEHIAGIGELDGLLSQGAVAAVERIRTGHGIRKTLSRHDIDFYSFATKYCSFHEPDKFPLFDEIVGNLVKGLIPGRRNLRDYVVFKEAIDETRKLFSISYGNYKELDMGLWVYGGLTGRRRMQTTDRREIEFYLALEKRLNA